MEHERGAFKVIRETMVAAVKAESVLHVERSRSVGRALKMPAAKLAIPS
jgi:hypothetical protein